MTILLTRPLEESRALAAKLHRKGYQGKGYQVLVQPLLSIRHRPSITYDLDDVQAILLTSANAVPALPPHGKRLPVFAVGTATAAAARAAGCEDVIVGAGTGVELADLVMATRSIDAGALLHLAGSEVRSGLAERFETEGYIYRRVTAYDAIETDSLHAETIAACRDRSLDAVLLFSPRSATILVRLLRRYSLERCIDGTRAICLSDAVATPCRALAWKAVLTATEKTTEALLARL